VDASRQVNILCHLTLSRTMMSTPSFFDK
jgi:hypothetical protein